jgi:hypothetical protein
MTNNLTSNRYVLSITVVLSVVMLGASIVPSFFSTSAFAASDDIDLIVDPTTQISIAVDENINVDPDLEFSEGCADVNDNDEVTQVNEQSTDQEVHKNNDAGDGGVVAEPSAQASAQAAANVNVDPDVIIVLGCDDGSVKISDNDKVTQVNEQSTDQEVDSDSEVGDGGVLFSPSIQVSKTKALNYNQDDDHVIFLSHPNL